MEGLTTKGNLNAMGAGGNKRDNMTISDYVFEQNIEKYARLLVKRFHLNEQLSTINDDLINLACWMTNEDINEANKEFDRIMREHGYE